MNETIERCGYVAIVGRPNVGKSTLLAILAANVVSFLVSHQPYSDGYLVLMNAFFLGFIKTRYPSL